MVFAFVGDSTMTRFLAMGGRRYSSGLAGAASSSSTVRTDALFHRRTAHGTILDNKGRLGADHPLVQRAGVPVRHAGDVVNDLGGRVRAGVAVGGRHAFGVSEVV